MNRRLLIATGLAAVGLDAVSLACFVAWLAKTDWMFGHHTGPPGQLMAAMCAGILGVLATVAWWTVCVCRRFRMDQEPSPTPHRRWLKWLFGAALVLALGPTGLIIAVGVSALPKSRWEARLKELDAATVTVPDLIEALKSGEYHQRWRAAQAVTKSLRPSTNEMPAAEVAPAAGWLGSQRSGAPSLRAAGWLGGWVAGVVAKRSPQPSRDDTCIAGGSLSARPQPHCRHEVAELYSRGRQPPETIPTQSKARRGDFGRCDARCRPSGAWFCSQHDPVG
jgi:hypothetical protein